MNPFVTRGQVRSLQDELRALAREQQQTNRLLAVLIEQQRREFERQRRSADGSERMSAYLATIALSVAMVSLVIGLLAVFPALPDSPTKIVGIVAAGMTILLFLGVAVRQAIAAVRMQHEVEDADDRPVTGDNGTATTPMSQSAKRQQP
ncbi:hypothetical protein [Glycomyces algeriensis]|uniref:Uncharacterized protein n=1 Tax=Glycomyces algeriensis TaxID=256037 RepID=A0A9W6GA19_9ACTN|nr:hypothetical protein [Glycomyces algeriensis]MDA1365726.1 hypothetical protein [Glycomyces algeriensis]MDR7351414.1 flagellar biosynthesis component FlhA [Glycomyces algeriensis]GLI44134.1 hypothetical protein GALLR39Z86_39840 [Glycomyces algeriensis]